MKIGIGIDMALADEMSASVVATVHDEVISSWGTLVGRDLQDYEQRIMTAMQDSMTKGNGYWVQGVTTGRRMGGKSMLQQMQAAGQMQAHKLHGGGDTLEEAVSARSDGWLLPERVVRHKDGKLPLRAVYTWDPHKERHVLTIQCYVWAQNLPSNGYSKPKTVVKTQQQKRSILTWAMPGDLPGSAVVDAFIGVADVLALHNGMPCFIVAPHSKMFNRLRTGKLPIRRWK